MINRQSRKSLTIIIKTTMNRWEEILSRTCITDHQPTDQMFIQVQALQTFHQLPYASNNNRFFICKNSLYYFFVYIWLCLYFYYFWDVLLGAMDSFPIFATKYTALDMIMDAQAHNGLYKYRY